jgi:hypothetical protein
MVLPVGGGERLRDRTGPGTLVSRHTKGLRIAG